MFEVSIYLQVFRLVSWSFNVSVLCFLASFYLACNIFIFYVFLLLVLYCLLIDKSLQLDKFAIVGMELVKIM